MAKIIKIWGVRGELKALPLSNEPNLLQEADIVFLSSPEDTLEVKKIKTARKHGGHYIISFYDVFDAETAFKYRDMVIYAKKESLPALREGAFYYHQIIGLSVVTTDGNMIGTVEEIFETGSNDVYVVKNSDREFLIPAIKDVITKIDMKEKRIIIKVMDGLLD
ncbi:MAG: ribosome maturation factor RimM [Nitrospirota bacterium]